MHVSTMCMRQDWSVLCCWVHVCNWSIEHCHYRLPTSRSLELTSVMRHQSILTCTLYWRPFTIYTIYYSATGDMIKTFHLLSLDAGGWGVDRKQELAKPKSGLISCLSHHQLTSHISWSRLWITKWQFLGSCITLWIIIIMYSSKSAQLPFHVCTHTFPLLLGVAAVAPDLECCLTSLPTYKQSGNQ